MSENITTNPLTEYASYLASQGKSANTIKSYSHDISLFFGYLSIESGVISRNQIVQYKEYLLNVRNNDAKSINRSLSSLKSYNEFLVKIGYQNNVVVLSMDYIKIQQEFSSPTNITPKEASIFLNKLKVNESFRNYAIATVIANSGLRISEILDIKIKGLTFKDNELTIIGKGNKQRTIIVNKTAIEIIQEYIINHRSKSKYANTCEYLWISNKGGKLQTCTIERIFNKYSNKITPHQLRHSFATDILENQILDVRQLQQQLGHKRLDTVMVYTHPTKQKMKSKLNGYSMK